jgi:hypothetical protein
MPASDQKQDATSDPRARESSKTRSSSAAEQAEKTAGAATDRIKNRARDVAEQQKAAGAEQIAGLAHAMGAAAGDLEEKMPLAAEYIEDVAGRLDGVASALKERSVDDMLGKVADFARRQPVAFFAGAVATGFALSRFAKSSADRKE